MSAISAAIIGLPIFCSHATAAEPLLPKPRPAVIDLSPLPDRDPLPKGGPVEVEQRAAGEPATPVNPKTPEPRPDQPAPAVSEPPPAPTLQNKPVFDLTEAKQCERDLRKLKAAFTVADPIRADGQCGWPRPLKLTALARNVKIRGDIKVRCEVALALARWSKEIVVPSAKLHLGRTPEAVRIDTSYQCRRRNNATTGKLSEHAFANGVDVMGFVFPDGQDFSVAVRSGSANAERAFQAAVRGGACAYFTTVLGPMTNTSHSDHFHLDLAVRRGGFRLCQ